MLIISVLMISVMIKFNPQIRVFPKLEEKIMTPTAVHVDQIPGHAIRRLQQIAVGIFHQEAQEFGMTPVQYAVLQTVHNHPGTDQRTLAGLIALDTSNTASVVDRLEARGLITRQVSPQDRRVRLLELTQEGEKLLQDVIPCMERAQQRILEPLSPTDQIEFMRLLNLLVSESKDFSRVPSEAGKKEN